MRALLLALATLAALSGASSAHAGSLAIDGVKYEPTASVAGQTLRLNGAATKHNKLGVRNFAVSVYVQTPVHTTEALLAAPGPKRISFAFLRTVQADAMGFLTKGVQSNMDRSDYSKTFSGVMQLGALLGGHPSFSDGDSFAMDYQPGVGTTFLINGKPQGEAVKEPEFFKAMLLIWLGPKPADPQMKVALLAG